MSSDFGFDVDGLIEQSGQSAAGRAWPWIVKGFLAAVFVASVATTFGFFATYAPSLGAFLPAPLNWIAAGLQGVLLLDTAAIIWSAMSREKTTTAEQQATATAAAWFTLCGALLVSFIFVLLSLDLGNNLMVDASGGRSWLSKLIEFIAVAVMTLAYTGNFGAVFLYSKQAQAAVVAKEAAVNAALRFGYMTEISRNRAAAEARAMLKKIESDLPQLAATAGQNQADNYLGRHYGAIQQVPAWGGGESNPVETMIPPAEELRQRGRAAEEFTLPGQQASPADGDGANFPPAR